ncbi:hypothetical protein JTB14_018187 [Gonioctena quinquepunctata]|nr:hypothetical protein JTB14_018187 [Gonioctena quinquepunctata]
MRLNDRRHKSKDIFAAMLIWITLRKFAITMVLHIVATELQTCHECSDVYIEEIHCCSCASGNNVFLNGKSVSAVTDEQYASMPTLFEVDDYDTCMMFGKRALYCIVHYQLAPLDEKNPPEVWNTIKEVSSSELHYRHDILRQFVCVPQTCPKVRIYNGSHPDFREELRNCLDDKHRNMGFHGSIEEVTCRTQNSLYEIDKVDYIFAAVFILYMAFVLLASLYDLVRRYDPEEEYGKFKQSSRGKIVTSFSIPSNWNRLKSIPTSKDYEKLQSVQGLRVYMTFIVVAVHTGVSFTAVPVLNPKFIENMNDTPDFSSDFPKRGVFLLSFHFMMSTWMLINSMLAKADKNEKVDLQYVLQSFLKRYLR